MKIMQHVRGSQRLVLVRHAGALRSFTPVNGLLDRLLPRAESLPPGGDFYLVLSANDEKLVCDLALCALGRIGSDIFPNQAETGQKFLGLLLTETKFRAALVPTDGYMHVQSTTVTAWSLAVVRK